MQVVIRFLFSNNPGDHRCHCPIASVARETDVDNWPLLPTVKSRIPSIGDMLEVYQRVRAAATKTLVPLVTNDILLYNRLFAMGLAGLAALPDGGGSVTRRLATAAKRIQTCPAARRLERREDAVRSRPRAGQPAAAAGPAVEGGGDRIDRRVYPGGVHDQNARALHDGDAWAGVSGGPHRVQMLPVLRGLWRPFPRTKRLDAPDDPGQDTGRGARGAGRAGRSSHPHRAAEDQHGHVSCPP